MVTYSWHLRDRCVNTHQQQRGGLAGAWPAAKDRRLLSWPVPASCVGMLVAVPIAFSTAASDSQPPGVRKHTCQSQPWLRPRHGLLGFCQWLPTRRAVWPANTWRIKGSGLRTAGHLWPPGNSAAAGAHVACVVGHVVAGAYDVAVPHDHTPAGRHAGRQECASMRFGICVLACWLNSSGRRLFPQHTHPIGTSRIFRAIRACATASDMKCSCCGVHCCCCCSGCCASAIRTARSSASLLVGECGSRCVARGWWCCHHHSPTGPGLERWGDACVAA